jgi:hypothetical protein
MTKGLAPSQLPGWPAAMNQQMAAAYCGLSVDTFTASCPVIPVVITTSKHGRRYLRTRLDEWLMSLDNPGLPKRQGMGAMWRASREAQRA